MNRGGARAGAGRPPLFGSPGVRRSVTLSARHWEGLGLLATMQGVSVSEVVAALVEAAVEWEARRVSADGEVGPDGWRTTAHGFAREMDDALLLVCQSKRDPTRYSWECNFEAPEDLKKGRAASYEEGKAKALRAYDVARGLKPR